MKRRRGSRRENKNSNSIPCLSILRRVALWRAQYDESCELCSGEFVDEYTVRVVDVFAMPQSGTGVSVEAVDHVFQTNMLDMLKQTGRCFFVFVLLLVKVFFFFFF